MTLRSLAVFTPVPSCQRAGAAPGKRLHGAIRLLSVPVVVLIGGCGAEVAGTAATAASLQAAQAQQAQAQQEQFKKKLGEAMTATAEAASAAGNQ